MDIRSSKDIDALYALFLGRSPENNFVRERDIGRPVREIAATMIHSEEFEREVVNGFCRRGQLPHRSLSLEGLPIVLDLIAEAGLAPAHAGAAAADWKSALQRVLAAPPLRDMLQARYGKPAEQLIELLGAPVTPPGSIEPEPLEPAAEPLIASGVDLIANILCRGWVIDRNNPQALLHVKIKLNGLTVKVVAADEFRRDIQKLYGGDGRCGFTIRLDLLPDARQLSRASVEIVELSQSITVLPECILELSSGAAFRAEADLRQELMHLRKAVERLEYSLPRLAEAQKWALPSYGFVRPVFNLVPSPPPVARRDGFCVVVIDDPLRPDATGATLDSLLAQTDAADQIVFLLRQETSIGSAITARVEQVRVESRDHCIAALNRIAERATASHLMVLDAGTTLAPEALAWFRLVIACTGAAVLYADAEELSRDSQQRECLVPVFRPAFDRELLLQRNYIGETFCVARDRYLELGGFAADEAIDPRHDFLLRADARFGSGALIHVPMVLARSRVDEPNGGVEAVRERLIRTVQEQLDRTASAARVVAHDDTLGRELPNAVKILWPDDRTLRTSVIILTRDSAEMVFALVASLRRHTAAWDRVEIVVVVNGTTNAQATYAFSEIENTFDHVRVIYHRVQFNWGAINNTAARRFTDGELLVFLNDDMICQTPDWDIRLRSQLARPDVAVIGGRLLYPNGAIQHAGIVFGHDAQTLHEAAGDAAGDGLYRDRTLLVHETAAVTGAFLACRRQVFDSLGGFDARRFTITFSDIDFCVRARATNRSVLYDPFLTWIHYESVSRGFDVHDDSKQRRFDSEFNSWRAGVPELDLIDLNLNPHLVRSPRPFELFHPVDQKAVDAWLEAQLPRRAR
jgi:GT2 family glycosyltransferase